MYANMQESKCVRNQIYTIMQEFKVCKKSSM